MRLVSHSIVISLGIFVDSPRFSTIYILRLIISKRCHFHSTIFIPLFGDISAWLVD